MWLVLIGLSMEALCKQPFTEPYDTVEKYMKSLWALLNSHWTRDLITKEKILTIELCSVLHR